MRKQNYFESGQHYLDKREYRAASIQFQNALAIDPRFVEAHFRLGLAYRELRQSREAYRELGIAIELQPSLIEARLAMAQLLLPLSQIQEARAQIEAVQALDPQNVRAQNLLAQTYLAENDLPRAIPEYEKAIQLAPNEPILWISSGFARVLAKDYAAAEKDFRRAIELDRGSVEAYRNLANLLQLSGRDREVEPLLRQALDSNRRSLDLHLVLAEALLRQGRVNDVEELLAGMKTRAGDFPNLRTELGDFWTWHNNPRHAVEEFQAALAEKPDVLIQKKLVSAYISLRRVDDAEHLNQTILSRSPKDLEARFFRGALRCLRGDSAGAVEELRAALKEEPQSLFGNYYLGLALTGLGKPEEAEGVFLECVRLNQNFGQAFEQLGEIRLKRQDQKAALEYARKTIELLPSSPDGYLLLARVYLLQGDGQKAEQVLTQVAKRAADSPVVNELLANAYLAQGKLDAGVRQYEMVWAGTQNPLPVVDRFADALTARGQFDLAIREVQQLHASHPEAGYQEILARLYLRKGDLASAETACRRALSMDRTDWRAHLHLGEVFDRQHRLDDAVSEYDQVIQSQPQMVPAYVLAGDIRLRQGRFEQAQTYYEAAGKREPGSPLAQHGLARLWAEQGKQLLDATALVQGLQQKYPNDSALADTLAWIYYQRGMYSSGLTLLNRCVEQRPTNALFQYHLGLTYQKLGQPDQARKALERALKLDLHSDRWEASAREAIRGTTR